MGNPFSLATDFPHLNDITITLGKDLLSPIPRMLGWTDFELFAKHIYKHDRIQVVGLNDPALLEYLYSAVERADDDLNRKGVQTKVAEYKSCIGRKNAIIW